MFLITWCDNLLDVNGCNLPYRDKWRLGLAPRSEYTRKQWSDHRPRLSKRPYVLTDGDRCWIDCGYFIVTPKGVLFTSTLNMNVHTLERNLNGKKITSTYTTPREISLPLTVMIKIIDVATWTTETVYPLNTVQTKAEGTPYWSAKGVVNMFFCFCKITIQNSTLPFTFVHIHILLFIHLTFLFISIHFDYNILNDSYKNLFFYILYCTKKMKIKLYCDMLLLALGKDEQ